MLGALFSGFRSGAGSTSLGSGGNPTQISGNEKQTFAATAKLPHRTSSSQVVREAQESGDLEAQAFLLNRQSKWQLKKADSALKILQTRLDHSREMMQKEAEFQRAFGQHGKALLRYGLNITENKANVSGYEANFGAALGQLDF